MGRRNKQDSWLPTRVYRGKSAYEWHPKGGGAIRLCPLDASPGDVWKAYEAAIRRPQVTVGDLAGQKEKKTGPYRSGYFASRSFLRKSPRTQRDYLSSWEDWLEPVFGKADATKVRSKHVREYMDRRGQVAEIRANREKAVLQNIFAWGYERSLVQVNPCIGVKSFPESPRDEYIEDDEYYAFLDLSTPIIQIFMELAYLCGARGQDVRNIKMPDLQEKGIFIKQGKTGKKQIKEWTPRLEEIVRTAKESRSAILERRGVVSPYLIVNRQGLPYTAEGLKSIWAKNRARIETEHKFKITWTFHDIKAKGISDFEGDKQLFSGHKTWRQMEDYNRKVQVVPTIGMPRKRNE